MNANTQADGIREIQIKYNGQNNNTQYVIQGETHRQGEI